jgi:4-carboxymuconolactone decarboxylase
MAVSEAVRALVEVSLALSLADRQRLTFALRRAMELVAPQEVEETLLQSYLFLGYPAALRALALWRELSGRAAPPASDETPAEWARRGAVTCQRVYGGQYERLRDNIAGLHPDMERWMIMEGYGKVLSRPGLDLATRELCIIALLAAQDAEPQLYSHLRGALNAGAGEAAVRETVQVLADALPGERASALHRQWESVRARRGTPEAKG